jgi:hypothetical protein
MIHAGQEFFVVHRNLRDNNGATVDTEAHLHLTPIDGSGTIITYTRSGGQITYSTNVVDPVSGRVLANLYEATTQITVAGDYQAQWHFPSIHHFGDVFIIVVRESISQT